VTCDLTVLIADDEPDIAELYALHLESSYETRTATSGGEALEKVDDAVDVAVLDRRMPDMSGVEVVEAVRNRGIDCHIIVVSAAEPPDEELPVDAYLQKPVDGATLEEAIEERSCPARST
jgi:CheY-like chemotaxis protein